MSGLILPPPAVSSQFGGQVSDLPYEVLAQAEALVRIHGNGYWARESHGLELYLASPKALVEDGLVELQKRHMSVNLSKYFGLDRWRNLHGTYDKQLVGHCHKYRVGYTMEQLLAMPTLQERGIEMKETPRLPALQVNEARLEKDEAGRMVPEMPKAVTPLMNLPADHPAVEYVTLRGFKPQALWDQFKAVFCEEELPEDRVVGRWYRKMPAGFKRTPQGRIILQAWENGVRVGWQARVLDRVFQSGGEFYKAYWHPYERRWVTCEKRTLNGKFEPLPHLRESNYEWDMVPYATATGFSKQNHLLGVDAALDWNAVRRTSVGIVVEGPLDAAGMGPPAMAILGAPMTPGQADFLRANFRQIFYVSDNDEKGRTGAQRAYAMLGDYLDFVPVTIPSDWKKTTYWGEVIPVKDPGDLTPAQKIMLCHLFKIPQ